MTYQIPDISLVKSSTLSAQAVFDHIVEHQLAQNEQSITHGVGAKCSYRSTNEAGHTLCCAAGAVISDAELEVVAQRLRYGGEPVGRAMSMNISDTHSHLEMSLDTRNSFDKHLNLLRACQNVHDSNEPKDWRWAYRHVAEGYGLEWKFD